MSQCKNTNIKGIDPVLKLMMDDNKRSKSQPEPKPTGYIKGTISRELSINVGVIFRGGRFVITTTL